MALFVGASMSSLALSMTFVAVMGVCAGAVYVVGFTLLQENVADEIRGRVFATLYTLIRLCLVIALAVAPLLAAVLNGISPGNVHVLGVTVRLPGVRLTLWLGSLIIVGAGLLAARALRTRARASEATEV